MEKVWFLTGSSRGLGLSLARAVLEHGDKLIATARNGKTLDGLKLEFGERILPLSMDVRDRVQIRAAVAEAVRTFGKIDVVVNNAGYANIGAIEDVVDEDFRDQIETNFFGVVDVTRAVLPILRAQRSGHIIQVSSIGGRAATPGLGAYQSAKWAVGGFSEVLALEVAPLGIRVTVVEPGGMLTDWAGSSMRIDEIRDDYQPSVGTFLSARKDGVARGDPAKVARAIIRIADEANPPLRLPLGSDAVFLARVLLDRRLKEDERWKALGVSTDFDGMEDFSRTPLAAMMGLEKG